MSGDYIILDKCFIILDKLF